MIHIKHYTFMIVIVCFVMFLSACNNLNTSSNNKDETKTENHNSISFEKNSEEQEEVVWIEVNKNGVNEDLLIKNIDEETLTYIAQQLQDVCKEIDEKGQKDKNYWLTGQWYDDVMSSKQYNNVISLGKKAMKPLFLIIYKSEKAGMYEWVCSKALTEISGFDFSGENDGAGWRNSKEFLEMFIAKIIEQRN
ncbi:hypothetical protein SAMN00017477_1533 [Peptoniphilus asaccharolyticus DSM 20463]|uniref:Lipoprotein n=1 Tax=Peptoniphilus asaccharolyticus DSM 20463 TaxID=573058 RepID=A0A1W1VAC3_PEPAS|nr:hypothetical protein [Peptoniphilus asaccharolyticus]MBL7575794.1 hypothetical protein [Peptoniphilus asaccharolyticus]SMB89914.1 hypothetical protein SAMN00017477_1533 [Peptoniphilus asaccharolyticus DSM 20463]